MQLPQPLGMNTAARQRRTSSGGSQSSLRAAASKRPRLSAPVANLHAGGTSPAESGYGPRVCHFTSGRRARAPCTDRQRGLSPRRSASARTARALRASARQPGPARRGLRRGGGGGLRRGRSGSLRRGAGRLRRGGALAAGGTRRPALGRVHGAAVRVTAAAVGRLRGGGGSVALAHGGRPYQAARRYDIAVAPDGGQRRQTGAPAWNGRCSPPGHAAICVDGFYQCATPMAPAASCAAGPGCP